MTSNPKNSESIRAHGPLSKLKTIILWIAAVVAFGSFIGVGMVWRYIPRAEGRFIDYQTKMPIKGVFLTTFYEFEQLGFDLHDSHHLESTVFDSSAVLSDDLGHFEFDGKHCVGPGFLPISTGSHQSISTSQDIC